MNVVSTNLIALLVMATLAAGQQKEAAQGDDVSLPVSISKIQTAISHPPAIKTDSNRPVFRVEVFALNPTVAEILGPDYLKGPVPNGGMTHQEFLDMVTPKLAQPYGGFSGKYLVAQTALTLAEQWALKQAISKFKNALTDHERDAARKEVMEALEALEKARREAGLPPK
jgi:hypothetical protein